MNKKQNTDIWIFCFVNEFCVHNIIQTNKQLYVNADIHTLFLSCVSSCTSSQSRKVTHGPALQCLTSSINSVSYTTLSDDSLRPNHTVKKIYLTAV